VGFPVERYEQECLALLQRIEAERYKMKNTTGSCRTTASGLKGARELRNLISSMNYEGRQTC
jgi:hypothetical protein